jgi:hypothetical protein
MEREGYLYGVWTQWWRKFDSMRGFECYNDDWVRKNESGVVIMMSRLIIVRFIPIWKNCCQRFRKFWCSQGDRPDCVYDECKGCENTWTVLRFLIKLLMLKAKNGWLNDSFNDLLHLLGSLLPKPNFVPKNTYETKNLISPLSMHVQRIHACPNSSEAQGQRLTSWQWRRKVQVSACLFRVLFLLSLGWFVIEIPPSSWLFSVAPRPSNIVGVWLKRKSGTTLQGDRACPPLQLTRQVVLLRLRRSNRRPWLTAVWGWPSRWPHRGKHGPQLANLQRWVLWVLDKCLKYLGRKYCL